MNLQELIDKSLAGFLQQEIVKKVNREADHQWALSPTDHYLPKYEKPEIAENKPGWVHFFSIMFKQLMP